MRFFIIIPALWVLSGGVAAWGEEGPCGTPDDFRQKQKTLLDSHRYDVALQAFHECFGDRISDDHPLAVTFNKVTPDTDDADNRTAAVVAALTQLRDAAAARELKGVDTLAWQRVVIELNQELNATKAAQAKLSVHAIDQKLWTLPDPGTNPQSVTILGGVIQPYSTGCAAAAADCPAYHSRADLLRIMKLIFRLIGYAEYKNLAEHYADAKLLDDQWRGYFNGALPQYWWEVAINGHFMGDLCKRDATGMQLGFCDVPESQYIILHPAASLQWVNGADDTDDLAPAFVVEVFGRNSWHWDDKLKDGVLYGQFGWSIIAAYSNPDGNTENWSYGLMVHKGRKLNLGVTTSGDGEYSILVNINLAEWAFANKAKYLDYLKALKKTGWQSLL